MFEPGQVYKRGDLHDRFGGQRQGGISTPANHRIILIFTGQSGEQHGYKDEWQSDGTFRFTGEGQKGDMSFIRGNAAIRDHVRNNKQLYLFADIGQGHVRYECQLEYRHSRYQDGIDTDGSPRRLIIFELAPTE